MPEPSDSEPSGSTESAIEQASRRAQILACHLGSGSGGASTDHSPPPPPEGADVAAAAAATVPSAAKIGGCVLAAADLSLIPPDGADLYAVSAVEPTADYPPFSKRVLACGLTFIAMDDVDDDFMATVARATREMLSPDGAGIDGAKQASLIRQMYSRRAACPMWKGMRPPPELGEDWDSPSPEWAATEAANSVCDVICYSVGGQTMEVVEHILHHLTDVGFHFVFPEWELGPHSALNTIMQEAIAGGHYVISQYEEEAEEGGGQRDDTTLRVELQEFGYWLITTCWGIQRRYGPFDRQTGEPNAEWKLPDGAALAAQLPSAVALLADTADVVLVPPSDAMLEALADFESSLGSSQPIEVGGESGSEVAEGPLSRVLSSVKSLSSGGGRADDG
eukprot:SAG11_NODE_2906_length_2846_cov_5.219148_1_plen_393_part_00